MYTISIIVVILAVARGMSTVKDPTIRIDLVAIGLHVKPRSCRSYYCAI